MNPRILRAVMLYDRGQAIDAEAQLRAALDEGDESGLVHALLGLCQLAAGMRERAAQSIAKALELEPNNPFGHYADSYLKQATLQEVHVPLLGRTPLDGLAAGAVMDAALKAVALAPDDERFLVRVAELHQFFGRWRESLEPAERALALAPDNVSAAIFHAEALTRTGRLPEARATLTRALEMNPATAAPHAGMGWALLRAGDLPRATVFFDEALRLDASLGWAQGGALECAKHRYRIYRWMFQFRTWFTPKPLALRALIAVVGAAAGFAAIVGLLEGLDPWVRPRLGAHGVGLVFTPLVFGLLVLIFFHDLLFLWLVRRHRAARTSAVEEHKRFARSHFSWMFASVGAGMAFYFVTGLSRTWMAVFYGLIPGALLVWVALSQFPAGASRRGWVLYALVVLAVGPLVGLKFHERFRGRDWLVAISMLVPALPVAIAAEHHKRLQATRQHDDALAARSRDSHPRPGS